MKIVTKTFLLLFTFFVSNHGFSQLCTGSLGDPLVNITFGAGSNPGAPLSAATTAYQFVTNDCPTDGFYTVRSNTSNCFSGTWYSFASDHTGDPNGYFMLVNASIQPSAFYLDTVLGLCGNSTYEFAAWLANVLKNTACTPNPIQPNITFSIEKTDGTIIQTFNTGNIPSPTAPEWKQYGFFFITPPSITDVVLRMTNNATGGCGNDIALDDITFRPCGPQLTPSINGINTTFASVCEGVAQNLNFNCTISAGFNNPTYQWQQNFNGGAYTDMVGQNSTSLTVNFLSNATIGIYNYRLSVAEAGNLGSSPCRIASLPITITVFKKPTTAIISNNPVCANNEITITATGGTTYQWSGPNNYSSNGNTITINNAQQINAGNYSVLIKDVNGCANNETANILINPLPIVATTFTDSGVCIGNSITLGAVHNGSIEWSPNINLTNTTSNTPTATPAISTKYWAIVTNNFGCKDSAYTNITIVKKPIANAGADKIIVANRQVILNGSIEGDWESFVWSPPDFINNINLLSPTVNPPAEKEYTLTVFAKNGCGISDDKVSVKIYEGIYIPNAFSPNGDFKNDVWNIPALEAYPLHELTVYNRYGQIVFERKQTFNGWDGKFKQAPQPTDTYIYIIDLKNGTPLIKGNFILLR